MMTGFMADGRWSLLPEFGDYDGTPAKVNNNNTKYHLKKWALYKGPSS